MYLIAVYKAFNCQTVVGHAASCTRDGHHRLLGVSAMIIIDLPLIPSYNYHLSSSVGPLCVMFLG